MKTPLKLKHMETGEIILAGIASIGTISLGGVAAIVKQAITNTSLKARLDAIEDEREDVREIRKTVIQIQISNSKYFTILEANQKTLETLTGAVSSIQQGLNNKPGG